MPWRVPWPGGSSGRHRANLGSPNDEDSFVVVQPNCFAAYELEKAGHCLTGLRRYCVVFPALHYSSSPSSKVIAYHPPSCCRRVPCFGSSGLSTRSPKSTHVHAMSRRAARMSLGVPCRLASASAFSSKPSPTQVATSAGFFAALIRATPMRWPCTQAARTRRRTNHVKTVGFRGTGGTRGSGSVCPFCAPGSEAPISSGDSPCSGQAHSAGSRDPSAPTSNPECRAVSERDGTPDRSAPCFVNLPESPCKSGTSSLPAVPNFCPQHR